MRNKETEADYRYFPDPNLMPIVIDDEWLEQIKANKPVALDEKAEAYSEMGISDKEIAQLMSEHTVAKLLDDVIALGCNGKDAAAWILTDCAGILRKAGFQLKDLSITAEGLSFLIKKVDEGKLNRGAAKKTLIAVIENGADPVAFVEENGFLAEIDDSMIESVIDKAIEANPQAVADYKSGKEKALMAIFGACMKELKGSGDPSTIRTKLIEKLK
jgi:aspartyl-tRNA(Asn)/glutamyl-tRNA(Gln) amidotransferase subunit B